MKILFITCTHSGGGGAETVLTTLVNHFPKDWHIDILEIMNYSVKKEPINQNINLLSPLANSSYKAIDRVMLHMCVKHPDVIKTLRGLNGYDVVIGWTHKEATFMLVAFNDCKKIAWFHEMVDNLSPNFFTYNSKILQYA